MRQLCTRSVRAARVVSPVLMLKHAGLQCLTRASAYQRALMATAAPAVTAAASLFTDSEETQTRGKYHAAQE